MLIKHESIIVEILSKCSNSNRASRLPYVHFSSIFWKQMTLWPYMWNLQYYQGWASINRVVFVFGWILWQFHFHQFHWQTVHTVFLIFWNATTSETDYTIIFKIVVTCFYLFPNDYWTESLFVCQSLTWLALNLKNNDYPRKRMTWILKANKCHRRLKVRQDHSPSNGFKNHQTNVFVTSWKVFCLQIKNRINIEYCGSFEHVLLCAFRDLRIFIKETFTSQLIDSTDWSVTLNSYCSAFCHLIDSCNAAHIHRLRWTDWAWLKQNNENNTICN